LKVFGSVAVALDKGHHNSKFAAKGKEYRMVGYSMQAKGYRLYDAESNLVIEKRDVVFDELSGLEQTSDSVVVLDMQPASQWQSSNSDYENDNQLRSGDDHDESDPELEATNYSSKNESFESAKDMEIVQANSTVRIGPGRPKILRTGKPGCPKKIYNILGAMVTDGITIPSSY
ncbi:hypothetical protein KR215_002803, partial [Drosophila sulfurigaster]